MRLTDFDYNLPKHLIAQDPLEKRDRSRLLVVDRETERIQHIEFSQVADFLPSPSLLVLNNTKVIPARLIGKKITGGKVEVFLLKQRGNKTWEVLMKPGKRVKRGLLLEFAGGELTARVLTRTDTGNYVVRFRYNGDFDQILERDDVELILVDNGSTDNSHQVLRELPIVRFVVFLNWTSIAIGLGVMGQLIASWVDQKLGFGALDWGIMILTWTVGGVISTLFIAGLGARLRRGPTLLLAVSLFGAAVFLYSLSRANVFVFSFNLICGACFFAINALSTGIIQSVVENKVLGRVNSFIFMSQGMMQIAALLLGTLATVIGLQFVYSGAGLVILLFGIIMALRNQTVRDFR